MKVSLPILLLCLSYFSMDNKIEFEAYRADGFILAEKIDIFDENAHKIDILNANWFAKVEIFAKTKKYYPTKNNDICKQFYLLKIKYKGKTYIVSGKNIYEKAKVNKGLHFQDKEKNKYELLPLTNFAMHSGCDTGDCGDF